MAAWLIYKQFLKDSAATGECLIAPNCGRLSPSCLASHDTHGSVCHAELLLTSHGAMIALTVRCCAACMVLLLHRITEGHTGCHG